MASGRHDVGFGKVLALEQEPGAVRFGACIRQAIAQVETRAAAATLAEPLERGN